MSGFKAGLYVLHPVDAPKGVNIATGIIRTRPWPPPDVRVIALKKFQHWLVADGTDGAFTVFAGRGTPNDHKWVEKSDALFTSAVRPLGEGTNFVITSAGENVWTIQIPNKDSLLTYRGHGESSQLTFKSRDGTTSQHFEATRIDKTK